MMTTAAATTMGLLPVAGFIYGLAQTRYSTPIWTNQHEPPTITTTTSTTLCVCLSKKFDSKSCFGPECNCTISEVVGAATREKEQENEEEDRSRRQGKENQTWLCLEKEYRNLLEKRRQLRRQSRWPSSLIWCTFTAQPSHIDRENTSKSEIFIQLLNLWGTRSDDIFEFERSYVGPRGLWISLHPITDLTMIHL